MRRASIRFRLTAWYIFLLALILIGFSLALYAALSGQIYRNLDDRLRAEAGVAANRLTQGEIEEDPRSIGVPLSNVPLRLLDSAGREVASSSGLRGAPIDPALLAEATRQGGVLYTTHLSDGSPARGYLLPLQHDGRTTGFLETAELLAGAEATLRDLALILFVAVPATLALASFGGLFIADRALRPIDAITREAQRIGEQHLDRRLNLNLPDDEVGRLARTFDAMLARLDTAFQRQRQFTGDASHELRTPLTVMKTNIGVTLNRPRTPDEYRAALSDLEGDVNRLARLTDDLLLLARADAGRPLIEKREMDVSAVARAAVDDLRPLAEAKSLTLNLVAPDALPMQGDPDRLQHLLSNLIDNAIKYTPRGRVQVRLEASAPDSIRITVADTGPGIAPEHVPHVFERFYRIDASRSSEQGGSGLGLAIAQSIAVAHGGSIDISSQIGAGTQVTVTLPVD